MKKAISFVLAALMLVSAVPTALATNDYTQGTQVVYTATGSESYTITVPAKLAPGGNGTVTLQGTWADNRIITVTAEPTVTLTNSIKAEDQKVLNVHFDGISEAGSNIGSQTFTEGVSVDDITNALFGTWNGKFNYNVEITGGQLSQFTAKTWNGFNPSGAYIWTDGENFYHSNGSEQYLLNGDTWEPKTWNGGPVDGLYGNNVWTDGTNIYYSDYAGEQYVLNGDTWVYRSWNGFNPKGDCIWTDGENIYYSKDSSHYVLNGDTWVKKEWNGLDNLTSDFNGNRVWTDGTNIYYSCNPDNYVLNGDTWEPITWNGFTKLLGEYIWSDGVNVYYSNYNSNYVLNGDTWEPKVWENSPSSLYGTNVWTDGTKYYYSVMKNQFVIS